MAFRRVLEIAVPSIFVVFAGLVAFALTTGPEEFEESARSEVSRVIGLFGTINIF